MHPLEGHNLADFIVLESDYNPDYSFGTGRHLDDPSAGELVWKISNKSLE
jgi:hypothetical protein